jgi:regulator of nucleoside diphosphate kinase
MLRAFSIELSTESARPKRSGGTVSSRLQAFFLKLRSIMSRTPPIVVAAEDRPRLLRLVAFAGENGVAEQLEFELDRAQVMPRRDVERDVIIMDSELEYEDVATGQRRRLRLVYPHDADMDAGRVSVLAPLGCALLGLRVGQEIDWRMPGGPRTLRVLSVGRSAPVEAEPG